MQIINRLRHPFKKKLTLAVIFVEYDRIKCGGSDNAFNALQSYLSNIKDCRITYLRVNNRKEGSNLKKGRNNIYTIGGDNTYQEFSGWQKGVKTVNSLKSNHDLVLFVNDMFLKPGECFLKDYANTSLLKKSLSEKMIIGRIDSTGQHYEAYGHDVSKWVCTNCFLVPMEAIVQIRNIVSIRENLEDFLPETFPGFQKAATSFFKENAPLNHTYQAWIIEWLTKRWHSKFEINSQTWGLFRTKVRNILNESLLTARLGDIGFKIEVYGDKFYY